MGRPVRALLAVVTALPLLAGVALMATRVDDVARFVTWAVVGFTVLATIVASTGVWVGSREPRLFVAGILPAIVVSYFLPAAPFALLAVVLVGIGALAVRAGGVASGVAAGTGSLMVLFVVLQDPAVECGRTSVSSSSGPWWTDEPSSSTSSGSGNAAEGRISGSVQVGRGRYLYLCEKGELTVFERE
jgi:hypothetical protein